MLTVLLYMLFNLSVWILQYKYRRCITKADERKSLSEEKNDKLEEVFINPLTPNGHFSGRTAPLTYRRCILYIYSTNIRTENFKHAAHSPFFPLQNAVYFITLPFLVPVLFTFYIQSVL
jgi:hypothetical protein